jgi:hypothetical protein
MFRLDNDYYKAYEESKNNPLKPIDNRYIKGANTKKISFFKAHS